MLLIAATLLFLVGLMHSILGGSRLIKPILDRPDLPIILGSIENSRRTLWFGWHFLTLFWWGQAFVLVAIYSDKGNLPQIFLTTLSISTGIAGLLALIASKGEHRSWILFLPIAGITAFKAFSI